MTQIEGNKNDNEWMKEFPGKLFRIGVYSPALKNANKEEKKELQKEIIEQLYRGGIDREDYLITPDPSDKTSYSYILNPIKKHI